MKVLAAHLGALVLAACAGAAPAGDATVSADAQTRLDAVTAGLGDPARAVPGAAAAIWIGGEIVWSAASGAASFAADGITPARPLTPDSPVRAASISKLAVALTALALADEGVVDLDAPMEPLLGFDLPVTEPDRVTIRSALAHTSGICDPDVYWAPLGAVMADLAGPQLACPHAPGEGWAYANINYGLVAQALETATGERFDRLAARYVLDPMALDAGFNFSGVSAARRASGASLHRIQAGRWIVQVDGESTLQDDAPALLRQPGADLADYQPGTNGTLFSPQGGLRASVEDLARLAALFLPDGPGAPLAEPVWTGAAEPGVQAWGAGPQILQPGQVPGRPELRLVGHAGEAYGLYGGAWAVPEWNAAVAYFVTGSDPAALARDPVNGLTLWESPLMDLTLDELERRLAASPSEDETP
jgi:CubicO group peptidase (beta-lactamase class C family)